MKLTKISDLSFAISFFPLSKREKKNERWKRNAFKHLPESGGKVFVVCLYPQSVLSGFSFSFFLFFRFSQWDGRDYDYISSSANFFFGGGIGGVDHSVFLSLNENRLHQLLSLRCIERRLKLENK